MTKCKKVKPVTLEFHIKEWLKQKFHAKNVYGEKLDRNGYSKTLMPSEGCFLCGRGGDLARHEVFNGSNRQTSKAYGCWCTLCPQCHERVHMNAQWSRTLKEQTQMMFEQEHSHEDFMILFGENYL